MALTPNTKLGPYEIVSPLGAGGMGEVYRARDSRLDRDVAIKVLPAHLTKSIEFKARFEREARSISQLTHPNVCTLYDIGHHDGADFLVMELLDGESLAQRLLKGPLSLEQVLKYGVETASALDAAHRKGVVHRDLKPGNIMLTKGGAKLLDFGLAKSGSVIESDSNARTVTQPLTTKGTLLGTFQYMAPEQLEGQEADARTDIFAFGAVLYEMATGKRAFEGASRASLIVSIMSSQPRPLSEIQPLTPPALDRLIRKCLAKDPDARWQSAADVADELRWITEGGSQVSAAATRLAGHRRYRVSSGLLAGIVLMAGSFVLAWMLKPSVTEPVTYLSLTPPAGDIPDGGLEKGFVALSPDGRTIAYTARRRGAIQLFVRDLGQRDAVAISGTEGANTPFFSPDGQWIGYFTAAALKKVPVSGGVSMAVCETGDNRGAVWADSDTIIVSPSFATPLMRLSAGGGAPTPITKLNSDKKERTHRWPDVLPGGEWVVFTVGVNDSPGGYDDCDIDAVSLKTGQRKTIVNGGSMARYSASGHLLFARQGNVFAAPIDLASAELQGPRVAVLSGVAGETTSGEVHFALSGSGNLLYVSEGAGGVLNELVFVGRDGKVDLLSAPPAQFQLPQLSPDGKQILVSIGPGTGKGDVWRFDLERNLLTRLTFLDIVSQVLWAPDGSRMLYTTDGVPGESFLQTLDGRSSPQLVLTSETAPSVSGFSGDGLSILFSEYGAPESNVSVLSVDASSQPKVIVDEPGPQYGARFSPDGKWVVYAADVRGGEPEIFVRRFDGGAAKWQVSSNGGRAPIWSHDGNEIFFLQDESVMSAKVLTEGETLSFAAPQKLFDMPAGRRYERSVTPYDVSADGTKFLFARQTRTAANDRRINVVLNWAEELKARVPTGK